MLSKDGHRPTLKVRESCINFTMSRIPKYGSQDLAGRSHLKHTTEEVDKRDRLGQTKMQGRSEFGDSVHTFGGLRPAMSIRGCKNRRLQIQLKIVPKAGGLVT